MQLILDEREYNKFMRPHIQLKYNKLEGLIELGATVACTSRMLFYGTL